MHIHIQNRYILFLISSKDKLLLLPWWKRLNAINLSLSSWLVSPARPLHLKGMMSYQGSGLFLVLADKAVNRDCSQTSVSKAKSMLLSLCLTPTPAAITTLHIEQSAIKKLGKEANSHPQDSYLEWPALPEKVSKSIRFAWADGKEEILV